METGPSSLNEWVIELIMAWNRIISFSILRSVCLSHQKKKISYSIHFQYDEITNLSNSNVMCLLMKMCATGIPAEWIRTHSNKSHCVRATPDSIQLNINQLNTEEDSISPMRIALNVFTWRDHLECTSLSLIYLKTTANTFLLNINNSICSKLLKMPVLAMIFLQPRRPSLRCYSSRSSHRQCYRLLER